MRKKATAILLSTVFLFSASAFTAAANAEPARVSPALEIIAESVELVKAGKCGSDIYFTESDFASVSGLHNITAVTVVSLPDVLSGKLMLNDREVMKNQTINSEDLSKLHFSPSFSYPTEATFRVKINGYSGEELECSIFTLDKINYAPVTGKAAGDSGEAVQTFKNITVFGSMKVLDPEKDSLTYEITKQPKKGIVTVTNRATGAYTYTPIANYTGKDSFTYTATDKYGNVSKPVEVNIEIVKSKTDVIFTDLIGHWAHNAAIEVSALGIMGASNVGGKLYFNPDEPMTRSEFLAMAMMSAGIEPDGTAAASVFSDVSEIPDKYMAYVSTAYNMGIIKGSSDENGVRFSPDEKITRAECAVVLNNLLELSEPQMKPYFEDAGDIPAWAETALYTLNSASIINGTGDGHIIPNSVITRAQGAQIFSAILNMIRK